MSAHIDEIIRKINLSGNKKQLLSAKSEHVTNIDLKLQFLIDRMSRQKGKLFT